MRFWMVLMSAAANSLLAGPALDLARQLAESGEHAQAAVEFRRLALETADTAGQGVYYWMAGHEYWKAGRTEQADRMLGQAEDANMLIETEVYLLRGETSRRRNLREAGFFFESLTSPERPEPVRRIAAKKLASVRLQQKDFEGARKALALDPSQAVSGPAAIERYEAGRDKSPMVGGLLGIIPGLGYAYSGEYANATRSLLLNALCIWGIVEFADDEAWAGVALVGFAEVTFYTGSIYGGADSAARYNRDRLMSATRSIEGQASFQPDLKALPVLSLQFEF